MKDFLLPLCALLTALLASGCSDQGANGAARDGASEKPLVVLLVPADGATEDGTKEDFLPLFAALREMTGLAFEVRVGESYAAVVEGLAAGQVDIAFLGAVAYLKAAERGAAELLGVAVENGESVYWSGLFVRGDSDLQELTQLKGQRLALGDPSSTSSFHYPLALLLDAGLSPANDCKQIVLAGSHVSSLTALREGRVDVAAAAITSFVRAVSAGTLKPGELRILKKSAPIPNPPLVLNPKLPAALKTRLREALASAHEHPKVPKNSLRGYGGKPVERYATDIEPNLYEQAAAILSRTERLRPAILEKASQ